MDTSDNGGPFRDVLSRHTKRWQPPLDRQDSDDCNICLLELDESKIVLALSKCNHAFHQECLENMLKTLNKPFISCPTCKKVYGVITGTMPTTGHISHRTIRSSLPGHEGSGTIEITFSFSPGIQGPEHPNPGKYYQCNGFPRTAYLPDSEMGVKMLHGIYMAWEQRVMFTVGRSVTTGRDNCVTWNDIHMKTVMSGGEHGFPDENFLKNLAQDLANFGITEAEISTHMVSNPHLRVQGHL